MYKIKNDTMKRIFATFLLYVFCLIGFAQSYIIENFHMGHGLSSNYTIDMVQDHKGYIWIATGTGLNRFDGHTFTVYTKYNSGLSSNELNAVLADPIEDKVWIGTQRDGLCIYDYATGEISSYSSKNGLLTNDITDLTESTDKGIWITHYHYGIDYYDRSTQTITPYSFREVEGLEGYCWTSEEDGQGNLYVGHDGQGLSIISLKDKKARNFRHDPNDPYSLPSNIVRTIYIDNNRNVWVGTDKGLALFNPQNERFTTFKHSEENEFSLLSDQIYDIGQMKDGTLWICSNMGGVSILNLQSNVFASPDEVLFFNIPASNNNHGLSSPNARCILQDAFDNIWIGNFRGGIDFISHAQPLFNNIDYYSDQYGKAEYKQVWGLYADNEHIWIGSENELAQHALGTEGNNILIHKLLGININPQTHINVIFKDKQQRVWTGLYKDGIAYYDTKTKRFHRIGDSHSKDLDIRCLYEDHDGKIWIGAEQGLFTYQDKWTREDGIVTQMTDRNIHGILRDKNGRMWIGTFSKGVNIFNQDNQLIYSFTRGDNKFPSNAVNHMIEDSKGRIWVATREGLILFPDIDNPQNYIHYSRSEGLNNTQVRAIQEDLNGSIWISTNGGISRLDEEARKFYNYNHHDGVPMGDFMDGSACITPQGIIYFGSQNGVCYFNPNELVSNRKVSPATITQFVVYNHNTDDMESSHSLPIDNKHIQLAHEQNTFDISFNVLDYSQSTQVEFTYQLEGLSNEWFNTMGEHQVTFRNIPHGNYTFKVKARFRNQEWDDHIALLHINIAPPFWLTWYAKLFYFLVVCAFIYMLLTFYKRRLVLESTLKLQKEKEKNLQELNDERLRFFTNITHELRTPLTLILGPLEDLLGDSTLSAKHNKKISIIHNSSLRLLDLINHILEFRKTQTQNRKLAVMKEDISFLVQEIGLKYKELNQNPQVNYHTEIATEDTELFFDRDMINMILDNLMSNAGKYTAEGDIYLRLRSVEENQLKYTEISVSDTGYGIAKEALPHIFDRYYQANSEHQMAGSGIGLALVKSLADLHEGILTVESELEVGTTFSLRLLTNNTYPNASHPEKKESKQQSVIETPEKDTQGDERPIILLVEDNADICEYVQSALGEVFEIITARNGKEGLEIAQKRIPNIIVSDIMMPIMDGLELCRLLKKDILTCHIPVVLLTAKDSLQDKEAGYAAGADSYLTKPFSANLLHSRINNILETRKMIATVVTSNAAQASQEEKETDNQPLTRLDNEFLQKVTEIIEKNLGTDKLDIAFIAEKMCMSHSTLYRKIKGLTEMSANEFIRKIKMRKSIELMKDGYSISEIAYTLGFSSSAYFRQCFKDEFGMSPMEYIKSH